MNTHKLLTVLLSLSIASIAIASPAEKTIFSTLEANQSKTYDLTIPKGKTSITVEQVKETTKPVLSCTFSNASGDVGLEEVKVEQCVGNLVLNSENKIILKVTNESKQTLDIKVRQFTVRK